MSETTWNDITTVRLGEVVDVYVWNVGDAGAEDGFRWPDVKVTRALPQTLLVAGEEEGEWSEYDLSQNGQYISHWMPTPKPPTP